MKEAWFMQRTSQNGDCSKSYSPSSSTNGRFAASPTAMYVGFTDASDLTALENEEDEIPSKDSAASFLEPKPLPL